jgi:O-antigen/teichoic acid export membrane protein
MGQKASIAALRAVAIIGQMGVVKLYTHYLLPAQLGQYFFFLTVSYSLNALIFVPMDYFQQAEVFRLKASGNSLGGLLHLNAKLLSGVATILIIGVIGLALIHPALLSAFCVSAIYALVLYLSTALKTFLNNQEEQVFVVMMLIAEIPIRLIAFTGIAKLGSAGSLSPIVSTAAALLIVGLCGLPRLRSHLKRFPGQEKPVKLQTILKFAVPISCSAVLNWLQLQGYRLVLVPLGYIEAVGFFATTAAIGNAGMNGAATVYQQIYLPRIYQTAGSYLRTYLKGAVAVVAFVLFIGLVLRVPIVRLLTNASFVGFAWLIGFGILIEAGNFIIGALVVQLSIDNNTVAQVKANIYAVLSVSLLFWFLRAANNLTVFTIGIPLVMAQIIVIVFLILQSRIILWNKSIENITAPSLS